MASRKEEEGGRKEVRIPFLPPSYNFTQPPPQPRKLHPAAGTCHVALRPASFQLMAYSTGPHVPGHLVFAGLALLIMSILLCQPIRQQLGGEGAGVCVQASRLVLERSLVPSQRQLRGEAEKQQASASWVWLSLLGTCYLVEVQPEAQ